MSRSSRHLVRTGCTIFAVLAIGLTVPASAQAVTAISITPAKLGGAHGDCRPHRRPVAIAPRMTDKGGGGGSTAKACK